MSTNKECKEIETFTVQLAALDSFAIKLDYEMVSKDGCTYFISYTNKKAVRIPFNSMVMLYNLTPWCESIAEYSIRYGIDILTLSYALNSKKFWNCKLQAGKRGKGIHCGSNWLKPNIQLNSYNHVLSANIENSFIEYLEEQVNYFLHLHDHLRCEDDTYAL